MIGPEMRMFKMSLVAFMLFSGIVLSNNWIADNVLGVDNEAPKFDTPEYDELTTGGEIFFRVNITDNEGLDTILFYFKLDGGAEVELKLDPGNHSGDQWFISLEIPDDALDFSFYFWANDTSGNHAESAHIGPLLVLDDQSPVFGDDKTLDTPTTGDPYTVSMNASDNIAIHKVFLVYALSGTYQSCEMILAGDDYNKNIEIPSDASSLKYSFNITDEAGNWKNVTIPRKDVIDNDAPLLKSHTPGTPKTGEEYLVAVIIEDNIDISYLYVNYSHNGENYCPPQGMQYSGGDIWNAPIGIPENATSMCYHFYAIDDADNRLDTSDDEIRLDVEDIIEPEADAGDDITVEQGNTVTFDATNCCDNICVDECKWTFTYDLVLKELDGAITTFIFNNAGVYEVTLNVADQAGNTDTDIRTVTVNDITIPTANAGADQTLDQGDEVVLDGSKSQDNMEIKTWTWTFVYEGIKKTLFGEENTFTFHKAGPYTVTLNVTDLEGNWNTDEMVLTVRDTTVPKADAGKNLEIAPGEMAIFNGSGSSDNMGIDSYVWNFTSGVRERIITGREANFKFDELGTYIVTLTVTDAAGNSATDNLVIVVKEPDDVTSPIGKISIIGDFEEKGGRHEITEGTSIEFDANESSDDVNIANYQWIFKSQGEENKLEGEKIEFIFEKTGMYTVTLTVTDAAGNSDSSTHYFSVQESQKVISGLDAEEGTPSWVIFLIVIGVLGLAMMIILILMVVRKRKEAEKADEQESEIAPELYETPLEPLVRSETIPTPEMEYLPPIIDLGQDIEQGIGMEVELSALAPGEQYMQLQGPPAAQECLPPAPVPKCDKCGKASEYYADYDCYWCEDCQDYVYAEAKDFRPPESTEEITLEETGETAMVQEPVQEVNLEAVAAQSSPESKPLMKKAVIPVKKVTVKKVAGTTKATSAQIIPATKPITEKVVTPVKKVTVKKVADTTKAATDQSIPVTKSIPQEAVTPIDNKATEAADSANPDAAKESKGEQGDSDQLAPW